MSVFPDEYEEAIAWQRRRTGVDPTSPEEWVKLPGAEELPEPSATCRCGCSSKTHLPLLPS